MVPGSHAASGRRALRNCGEKKGKKGKKGGLGDEKIMGRKGRGVGHIRRTRYHLAFKSIAGIESDQSSASGQKD